VAQHERWTQVRVGDDGDAPCARRIAGVGVVVPAHQRDRERGMCVTPEAKRDVECRHATGCSVQEVAEDHEPRCARAPDQRRQPREVVRGRAARYGDTARAECRRLAEMNVGDEQGRCARPMQSAFGEQ